MERVNGGVLEGRRGRGGVDPGRVLDCCVEKEFRLLLKKFVYVKQTAGNDKKNNLSLSLTSTKHTSLIQWPRKVVNVRCCCFTKCAKMFQWWRLSPYLQHSLGRTSSRLHWNTFRFKCTILSDEDILGILPRPPRVRGCTGLRRRSLHGRTQATRSLRWSTWGETRLQCIPGASSNPLESAQNEGGKSEGKINEVKGGTLSGMYISSLRKGPLVT